MKQRVVVFGLVAILVLGSSFVSASDVKLTGKAIALVNNGALSSEDLNALCQSVQGSLLVPVRGLDAAIDNTTDVLSMMRACVPLMDPTDVVFVLLAKPEGMKEYLMILPDQSCALVNIAPLVPDPADAELLAKRIEQQTMRAIGFLFGVGFTPNVHNVHRHLEYIGELDERGRNYDPPSLGRFHDEAIRRGMTFLRFRRQRPAGDEAATDSQPAPEEAEAED